MFYQKAAVMDMLVFKSGFFRFYAPLHIHPSESVLSVVKLWNCQSQNTCVLKKCRNSKTDKKFMHFLISRPAHSLQICISHQILIGLFCNTPAFTYTPYNKRLSPVHITRCKYFIYRCFI